MALTTKKMRGPQKDQSKRFDWKKVREFKFNGWPDAEWPTPCRVLMRDGVPLVPTIPQLSPPPEPRSKIIDSINPLNWMR